MIPFLFKMCAWWECRCSAFKANLKFTFWGDGVKPYHRKHEQLCNDGGGSEKKFK